VACGESWRLGEVGPAVPVVIAAYLVCGAAIRVAGAIVGLE
jgi:hypothetical protein